MLSLSATPHAFFAEPRQQQINTVRRSWSDADCAQLAPAPFISLSYSRLLSRALIGPWQPLMQLAYNRICAPAPAVACSDCSLIAAPSDDDASQQQLQFHFASFVPSDESPAHSGPLLVPSYRRRLQSSLRALGWLPVTHSIFTARDGPSALQSATRGAIMVLLSSAVFVGCWHAAHMGWTALTTPVRRGARAALRMQPPKAVVHGSEAAAAAAATAAATMRAIQKLAERTLPPAAAARLIDLMHHLRALEGAPGFALQCAAYSSLVLGSIAAFSLSMGVARVLGWVAPSRDSYSDISSAMRQVAWPLTDVQASALDMPAQRRLSWALHLHPFLSRAFWGPFVEEIVLSRLATPLLYILSWLPGVQRVPALWLRVLVVSGLSGSLHPASKAPSAAVLAVFSTLLCAISPWSSLLLPTVFHAAVNYLACDAYAAISPLRGLQLEPEPENEAAANQQQLRWCATPAAQAASLQLRSELLHYCDPAGRAFLLRLALFVRTAPLLRLLVPSRKHPMFRQPKPSSASPSSPRDQHLALPSGPCALSSRYCSVVAALFTMLDHEQRGYLSARSLGFLLLLWPSHLELLRGAFAALDAELAATELEVRVAQLEAARDAEDEADAVAAAAGRAPLSSRMERSAKYARAQHAVEKEVSPLEPDVIHVARQLEPDDDSAWESVHAVAARRPFPCAEWMGVDTRGGGEANAAPADYSSLTPERQAALDFLQRRMQASGAQLDAPAIAAAAAHDEPLDAIGWQLSGLHALLYQRFGVSPAPGPARPLAPRQARRFQRLATKFEAYANLLQMALWETHLRAYGEEVPDEPAHESSEDEDEEEKAAEPPQQDRPTTRRFTCRSMYAMLRDCALLDVEGTDALMAHATLVLSGRVPHPMQVFNVSFDTFQTKQRPQRRR